jgi:hypothetical protein
VQRLVLCWRGFAVRDRLMGLIVRREVLLGLMSVPSCTRYPQLMRVMRVVSRVAVVVPERCVARRRMKRMRRMHGTGPRDRAQVFAAAKHFEPPVAMTVKVTVAMTVRSHCPDIGIAADEHDVAVRSH